ncbi:alpha/beta hydrolase [Streptomyces sp. NBC_01795]|uniref:alpha/beta hydrolase family protein n=1 Tax=Streptomyces sp. NBC_01795 TaxID=2975943 RepID=UPI002DDBFAB1|nr:alpha/beta hydrolase [Streptomyces sp. NBC_01795]WSA91738.1 alpha/beta hydrolase [Streptomyces sp. NBC_01795]
MISRRSVAGAATVGAAMLLAGGAGGAGVAGAVDGRGNAVRPRLPKPTGPHAIGVTTLYLVDRARRDPLDPYPVREVMASVFYPARATHGAETAPTAPAVATAPAAPTAPYMTQGAAASFVQIDVHLHGLPAEGVDWAGIATHAHPNAPAETGARRPVLLYSPGGGDPRGLGTGLAEELAAHGYIVVTVDHPGDGSEVEFPVTTAYRDEKVRETVFRGDPRADGALFQTVIETRIADLRFVLDALAELASGRNPDAAGRPVPEHLAQVLDLRRVGVYGHSAGGTAAAGTLYEDRRVHAAVNLEGYLDHTPRTPGELGELFPVARHGTDRPLLLVESEGFDGKQEDREALLRSWKVMLAHPHGNTRRRRVDDAMHWIFTDYAAFAPQLQAEGLMSADARDSLVGPVAPATSVPVVRRHVHGFFARHLPVRTR